MQGGRERFGLFVRWPSQLGNHTSRLVVWQIARIVWMIIYKTSLHQFIVQAVRLPLLIFCFEHKRDCSAAAGG